MFVEVRFVMKYTYKESCWKMTKGSAEAVDQSLADNSTA
jgi:hypothetical protein